MKIKLFFLLTLIFLHVGIISADIQNKPFIVGDLYGQLGNQMFQIATTLSLALDNNAEALFPDLQSNEYGLSENHKRIFKSLVAKMPPSEIVAAHYENDYSYAPITYTPNMKIHGHFQSWKYFDHHKKYIQKLFAPDISIQGHLLKKYNKVILDPKTVSIHIRTYSKEDPDRLIYAFNGVNYVKAAMTHFPKNSHYIVFSDDIPWCKTHLSNLAPHIRFIEGESYISDFYLQSMCRHHIISNSSFSWWAAYLNRRKGKKVVAPGKWFQPATGLSIQDLIPHGWVVLNSY